uniref:Uncharacterized protein n=1 Tax=Chrysemys picta bellii TaxID=8478 RepID=A0A8C3FQG1_CHRPI
MKTRRTTSERLPTPGVACASETSPSATRWPGCQWHRTPNRYGSPQPRTPERSAHLSLPSSWDYSPPHSL